MPYVGILICPSPTRPDRSASHCQNRHCAAESCKATSAELWAPKNSSECHANADLDISNNRLTHQCCEALEIVLRPARSGTISRLASLRPGAAPTATGLGQAGALTRLALAGNSIGDRGASALCVALARPAALTSLNLQACGLSEKACISLCALLQVLICP